MKEFIFFWSLVALVTLACVIIIGEATNRVTPFIMSIAEQTSNERRGCIASAYNAERYGGDLAANLAVCDGL